MSHWLLNIVLPVSEITKELPAGTGIFCAMPTAVFVELSCASRVRLTELEVLLEKVPPIKILLVAAGDVYALVNPRKLTL